MKRLGILLVVVTGAVVLVGHTLAQTTGGSAIGFGCIGDTSTHHYCADGSTAGLRGYTGPLSGAVPYYASVTGYYAPGDSGSGNYVRLGAASSFCNSYSTGQVTGTGNVGQSKITSLAATPGNTFHIGTLFVGELVSASGADGSGNPIQAPPGTEIASIDTTHSNITLTLPLTGTAIGSVTTMSVAFTGDNHGTLITDSESTPQCWRKTNYRGDPHEFGAVGDGSTDDTTPIQYWIGAGGPWDATVASNANSHTGATIYQISSTIYCWPGINIRAPAVDATGGNAPVTIQAVSSGGSRALPPPWPASTIYALMVMEGGCRVSGLSVDANNNTSVQLNTVVIDTGALRPIIDSHATILNGYRNLFCPYATTSLGVPLAEGDGLRVSDSVFSGSGYNNVEIDHCDNTKMSNDLVAQSGADGIVFSVFADFNLWNSTVQQSQGPGLLVTNTVPGTAVTGTPDLGSIVGNFFDSNGESAGPGLEFDGAAHFSVCGNHFNRNDNGSLTGVYTAHIRFGGGANSNAISFCGNDYRPDKQAPGGTVVPSYVYDIEGTGTTVTNTTFYENPIAQTAGVFSPNAATVLPQQQALPGFPANVITGLTMSSVSSPSSPSTVMSIAAGQAADSTNSVMIGLPLGCTVDLSNPNPAGSLGQLDTGTVASNTTYYFFLIADSTGANAPGCIASKNPAPTFGTTAPLSNYNLYRAVGVMYTLPTLADITPFTQVDDTFTLASSVAFTSPFGYIGTSSTPVTIPSVPSAINVQAFGRCVGSAAIFLSGGNIAAQTPSSGFGAVPAYMVDIATPDTAYPFSLYTVGVTGSTPGGTINAAAVAPLTTLKCFGDGWVWHRGK